jgi:hypothetical protein
MQRTHQTPFQRHSYWSENVADELQQLAIFDIAILRGVLAILVIALGTAKARARQDQGQDENN